VSLMSKVSGLIGSLRHVHWERDPTPTMRSFLLARYVL
jgi:hypothetical protein